MNPLFGQGRKSQPRTPTGFPSSWVETYRGAPGVVKLPGTR